jgi:two-component system LytT family response regulator
MKIRVLLVDDEERAVSRLRQLCAEHPDIAVIGEARTGPEALEKLQTLAPRLLFLDINLRGDERVGRVVRPRPG